MKNKLDFDYIYKRYNKYEDNSWYIPAKLKWGNTWITGAFGVDKTDPTYIFFLSNNTRLNGLTAIDLLNITGFSYSYAFNAETLAYYNIDILIKKFKKLKLI